MLEAWYVWLALFAVILEMLRRWFVMSHVITAGKLLFYALVRSQGLLTGRIEGSSYAQAETVIK